MSFAKKNSLNRVLACALAVVMALMCMVVPAFAADHPNDDTMIPTTQVTAVGTKAFYKIDTESNTVVYADRDDGNGWTAVPSAYISGSEYNKDDIAYGAYVNDEIVKDDGTIAAEVVFVPLSDCFVIDEEAGLYGYAHGTRDGATVSEGVDHADNYDPTMGTDFYLRIENGLDPDGPSKDDVIHAGSDDNRVSYDITVRTKSSYQLDATVPLYVCMYGYRGTGTVVTPDSDAYKLKNYSTVNMDSNATIVDIVKLTEYSQILDTEHSDEELAVIGYKEGEGYIWWYSMPEQEELDEATADGYILNTEIADQHLNASGECYVIYIDDAWHFKAAGVLDGESFREEVTEVDPNHPLSEEFMFNEWNFGTTPKVGDTIDGGKDEGLAIKVTELQAVPATWRMVPVSTAFDKIQRGELAMSIAPKSAIADASAIDLAECSAPVDITDRGWFLDAPAAVEADGHVAEENATELPIITSARMAGGNVNPSGCTSVVRVIYTVTPMFEIDNGQTSTVGTDAVTSNQAA